MKEEVESSSDDDWVLAIDVDRVHAALSNDELLHPIVLNEEIVPVLIDSACGPNIFKPKDLRQTCINHNARAASQVSVSLHGGQISTH